MTNEKPFARRNRTDKQIIDEMVQRIIEAVNPRRIILFGSAARSKTAHGEEQGFLKGEFLDWLHRLPKWNKTKYYCSSYRIYEYKQAASCHTLASRKQVLIQP